MKWQSGIVPDRDPGRVLGRALVVTLLGAAILAVALQLAACVVVEVKPSGSKFTTWPLAPEPPVSPSPPPVVSSPPPPPTPEKAASVSGS